MSSSIAPKRLSSEENLDSNSNGNGRLESLELEVAQLAKKLQERNEQIGSLRSELHNARVELSTTYRIRDVIGITLRVVFDSWIWKLTRPAMFFSTVRGNLRIVTHQLVPLTNTKRRDDGSWEGSGFGQFLVPAFPIKGWVRVRAKIRSSVSSRACMYVDTGKAFHEEERIDLSPVNDETTFDRTVPFPRTAYGIRFDPIGHCGDFVLENFFFEPTTKLRVNFRALVENVVRMFRGGGTHKPSIARGLRLLFTGKWRTFHHQLLSNAGCEPVRSEYDIWEERHHIYPPVRDVITQQISTWLNPPTISVIVPVYNSPETHLRECIESVIKQIYPHWELCIADDASPEKHVRRVIEEYTAKDPRVKAVFRETNGNIAAATNSAFELATGQYVAMLDHDDTITEHALFRMAEQIVADPSVDMIYSDEDKLTPQGKHFDPFFKPDWSPEYFLACMYTCHLAVYRAELVRKVGGWRSEFDHAQDYDLVLRIIRTDPKIHHVPDILYHWRMSASSTASGPMAKPQAHVRAKEALELYLRELGRKGSIEDGPSIGFHTVKYEVVGNPMVSIIIPSACRKTNFQGQSLWLVLRCIESIRRHSTYTNVEIIVLDQHNMPEELEADLKKLDVRRVSYDFDFNWSRVNNYGAAAANGEFLLFLNDDMEVISPDWLERMIGFAQWPEIGAVGAKLIFPDNTVQHAGVFLPGGNPAHPYYRYTINHPGHFFSNMVHRNWSAVTGACLMTRAKLFSEAGGFDCQFPLNFNDVEYCLRLGDQGLRMVCVPQAQLYHYESLTRTAHVRPEEISRIHELFRKRYRWDPYYNPNLATDYSDFRVDPIARITPLPARVAPTEELVTVDSESN